MYLQEIRRLPEKIIRKHKVDLKNLKVYRVQDFDLKWLKKMVDFEINMFGDLGMDEWGLVPQIRHGNVFMLKDENSDKIVGLAILMRDWEDTSKAYLFDYAIQEEYQGLSLGYHFLVAICDYLKDKDFQKMSLTVDINNAPAIKLYKNKVGFEIVRMKPDEYGEGHDRYIMELNLHAVN